MEKQYCWYKLNIDTTSALRNDWKSSISSVSKYSAEDIFNAEWLNNSVIKKLRIGVAFAFNRPPWQIAADAHIDFSADAIKQTTFSINWVIDCKDSEMIWFDKPSSGGEIGKSPYSCHIWPINTLTEIDRCNIQLNAVVTRVDVPHAISVKSEPRISIAARSSLKLPWNLAIAYLRSNNLLIERD
jgi:hypothetical protein